jgi:single-strand DNA-binding protein
MASINKVILIGNLGKDPEIRHLEGGVAVARFPIATSESYKDKTGNKVERTEWHNIVAWRGLAEVSEKYLKKGQAVYIEGKIRTNNYQDKEGIQRYTTEIVADNMTMLGGRPDGSGNGQGGGNVQENNAGYNSGNAAKPEMSATYDSEPDDLPF